MLTRAVIVLSMLALSSACSRSVSTTAGTIDAPQSVCALPTLHANHDGRRVRVRGLFTIHAHGSFLRDEKCPGYMLSLESTESGPDISLCTPEKLVQAFGCPGGNDNGPVVTVSGMLKPSNDPKYGRLVVDEMRDFENVRTGERLNL